MAAFGKLSVYALDGDPSAIDMRCLEKIVLCCLHQTLDIRLVCCRLHMRESKTLDVLSSSRCGGVYSGWTTQASLSSGYPFDHPHPQQDAKISIPWSRGIMKATISWGYFHHH